MHRVHVDDDDAPASHDMQSVSPSAAVPRSLAGPGDSDGRGHREEDGGLETEARAGPRRGAPLAPSFLPLTPSLSRSSSLDAYR